MNTCYLLLGGNLGNRWQQLQLAVSKIGQQVGTVLAQSSVYETEAWGMEDQPAFLNQVVKIQTAFTAHEVLQRILNIEQEMGRLREMRFGPRTIDIDILLFNQEVIKKKRLQVPHPRMALRRFTMMPLAELAPDLVHPELQQTMQALLMSCSDPLAVKKYFPESTK